MSFNYHSAVHIHGRHFGEWRASSPDDPYQIPNSDQVLFTVVFTKDGGKRTLKLRISNAGIHHDADGSYQRHILDAVKAWLDFEKGDGEIEQYN